MRDRPFHRIPEHDEVRQGPAEMPAQGHAELTPEEQAGGKAITGLAQQLGPRPRGAALESVVVRLEHRLDGRDLHPGQVSRYMGLAVSVAGAKNNGSGDCMTAGEAVRDLI